ncbi:family 78 glycoside hydrolase catalytic domain [Maribellus sediminis]|uniref:family 78 glycoside hydrolase catalytic domain n=1 Tax=Maribellus sediminis TaxID=2696285 RepID=UPI00143183F2|nr:family 78 glycoside hydrolase catalytic domain [Maribellus sediminis]
MKSYTILFFLFILISCTQTSEQTDILIFDENVKANWITDTRELPQHDSLFYSDRPTPLFRKEFVLDNEIKSATLYITAAGYYKATLNGQTIGKNVLDPAWTDYSKRIYYSEYDVTSSLINKTNCLGVSLGNGFYNPLPLQKWGRRNLRKDLNKVGKPAFISKLVIAYKNGKTQEIVSDSTWKFALGPLLQNDVYIGNVYDARKKIVGWNTPVFDDTSWNFAQKAESPGGEMQKAFFPPVQIVKEFTPVKIYSPVNKTFIVDMGANFTGTYKIKLSGNVGDTITFRFGERVYEDGTLNPMTTVAGQIKRKGVGGPGAPDIAWQTDSYIVGDTAKTWFTPEFTYHVYRYMEITGLDEIPQNSDIKGLFIHSNVMNQNSFSCSSKLLNSIQEATERTFLANLISVQSDCPAREKFGYGGDLNATSESFIYNFDMQAFYRKTIYDWIDAMNDSIFVDTAPYTGIDYCGISWESAFLITQYYLYLYYADTEIIKELYKLDNKWMDKVARIHPDGIVDNGLSDHESMEPVPVQLTGTAHYLQCARIMQVFAGLMGDKEKEQKYERLAEKLKNQIRTEFWDKPVEGKINRQTLYSTLLYHGIIPEKDLDAASDSLLMAVHNGPSGHFITGIFGTKYVLETLSQYLTPEKVFEIVNSTEFPGWGFMIDNGATTLWETWKESDNTYSNCHPMFGTVTEWYYRWLGGIRPQAQNPGFRKFTLAPSTPEGLDFVKCVYHSPHGEIVSNWEKTGENSYLYEMKIPSGSTADVKLKVADSQSISIQKDDVNFDNDKIEGLQTGSFKLSEGSYIITVSTGS